MVATPHSRPKRIPQASCLIEFAPPGTMKVYQSSSEYEYSFPAVTLAYFLRYPNPYSRHVLSTDVIDRYIDPETQRLHTTRLHLKRSKVPAGILKLIPRGLAGPGGASQSYVLEKSVIDVKEGWMETESRNMEWTGILSVVEKQTYRRQPALPDQSAEKSISEGDVGVTRPQSRTSCKTIVTFVSKLGQGRIMGKLKKDPATVETEDEAPKLGFFSSWTTAGLQRTVELIGVKRTKTAIMNGKEGMNVVLERLRSGGLVGVLEGMRRDSLEIFGREGPWKQVWQNGRHAVDQDKLGNELDRD